MSATNAPGPGPSAQPAQVELSPRIRAALDRVVARSTAVLAPVAGLITATIGFAQSQPTLVFLGVGAIGIGGLATWQLRNQRPHAIVLNTVSAVLFGVTAPFMPAEVSAGLSAGVVVFTLTGIPLAGGRFVVGYSVLMTAAWLSHPVWALASGQGLHMELVAGYALQAAIVAFGLLVVFDVRSQLGRSEARYSYLFSQAPVALWENDFSGVSAWLNGLRDRGVEDLQNHLAEHHDELVHGISMISTVRANDAAAKLMGASDPNDLVGHFPPELVDKVSASIFQKQFVAMWESSTGGDMEYRGRRFDGSEFDGIMTWVHSDTRSDGFQRVITAVSDITHLRAIEMELESREAASRALLEALPDLLFVCAADGTYLDYHVAERAMASSNSVSEEDLYVPASEFLGKRPHEVLPHDLAKQMSITITTALETNHTQAFEYTLPIGGTERHWEMRVAPLKGKARVLALARDITDAVKARIELERLVESKDDFIAAISHEIRTPLTGIVGFSQLLQDTTSYSDPEERHRMIAMMASQSADLTHIVEDLLVAAKADLGRLQFASVPTNLRAQAAQVLEGWDPEVAERIELFGEPVSCVGDPARVRQIIRNLISNALRYGGDHIGVRIESGASEGHVVVTDDGPGIPTDQEEAVFQPYHRVSKEDGLTAALGIGLPISRTLARFMHGDLNYEHVGGETRFTLTLPLLQTEASARPHASAAVPAGPLGRSDAR